MPEPDYKSAALNAHTHDYEETCTPACPASPWFAEGFSDPAPELITMPDWSEMPTVETTEALLTRLTTQVEALTKQQEAIAVMLATVVDQVGPTLDSIQGNPMFKMMFGGK